MKKINLFVILLSVAIIAGGLFLQQCSPASEKTSTEPNEFVGDAKCQSCHTSEFNDWKLSDHYHAMLPANDSTVAGDFNNVTYTADGITSTFYRKDGKFMIKTQGEDGSLHDYEVKYTFGYRPLQQYLVEFPGGKMQATRVCWDIEKKRWFHQYSGQKIAPNEWIHWTGNGQNWNTMCAYCHSTDLKKNYNLESDSYHTTYKTVNVSCESCHGAGKNHIDYVNGNDFKEGRKIANSYLVMGANPTQTAEINSCAPCHAVRMEVGSNMIASGELLDNFIPEIPTDERFYADGQVKLEDFIHTSFLQSKMYRHNVKCSNCHNPHTGRVLFTTNNLCLQCHGKSFDDPGHTFHATNTVASQCISCHMPTRTFMEVDERHDHSFRVPRPDLSVKYQTPNACNDCHKDKSMQWAADAVDKWFGPNRKYHFAEDLIPGSLLNNESEGHLVKLIKDTAIPSIIKATAAFYLGNVNSQNSLNTLIQSLQDPDAQVRYRALRGLANYPVPSFSNNALPLLSDKVRAVRVAAADLFLSIPAEQFPSQYAAAFSAAKNELYNYLTNQADFAVGSSMLADYFVHTGDNAAAIKFYLRSIQKDSMLNYARLNLASVYNEEMQNQAALYQLQQAQKIDPKSDRVSYNLALLNIEMKDTAQALLNFKKAVALSSTDPRLYYNYGLLLMQLKKNLEAENSFTAGLKIAPMNPDLHYALAYFYLTQKMPKKALPYANFLKQNDPQNPQYQSIFSALRL